MEEGIERGILRISNCFLRKDVLTLTLSLWEREHFSDNLEGSGILPCPRLFAQF